MDAAKRKRILGLVTSHRETDRAQGIELLRAVEDRDLWTRAIAAVRLTDIVGRRQVALPDLPLLAAAPADLPEAMAIRAGVTAMWLSHEVHPDVVCLDHLAELVVSVEPGSASPRAEPSLALLRELPALRALTLYGADLGDGSVLAGLPLRALDLHNAAWTRLPELPLERIHAGSADAVDLGDGLPAVRTVEVHAPNLAAIGALAKSARLESLVVSTACPLADLGPLGRAVAAGAPLARVELKGVPAVTSLGPLTKATALDRLDLGDCGGIADLGPLAGCAALRHLGLRGSAATDLAPLAGLTGLQAVDLRGSAGVTDLRPLVRLPDLRVLALWGAGVPPERVPAALRPYATWAEEPLLDELVARPRTEAA